MKNLLKLLPFLVIAFAFKSCTVEPTDVVVTASDSETSSPDAIFDTNCANDLPKTRMINNGTINFDLQVINIAGVSELTISSIGPGTTTNWNDFNVGEVLFAVSNNEALVNDEKVVLQMDTCMGYEIVIDSNNEITSLTPISF